MADLSQLDVVETDLVHGFQFGLRFGYVVEKFQRLFYRHLEHVGDGFTLELDFQRSLSIVPSPIAHIASDENRWQEVHLDFVHAFAATSLTSACPSR